MPEVNQTGPSHGSSLKRPSRIVDVRAVRANVERLHAVATELLPPLGSMQPIRHWSGLRPGSPDNIPIIDRHPDFDNVFVNTGHYRYGVTMAPASAELLVDLMEGKTPALDPTPYSWQAALSRSWGDKL